MFVFLALNKAIRGLALSGRSPPQGQVWSHTWGFGNGSVPAAVASLGKLRWETGAQGHHGLRWCLQLVPRLDPPGPRSTSVAKVLLEAEGEGQG